MMLDLLLILVFLWVSAMWLYGVLAVANVAQAKGLSSGAFILAALAFLPVALWHVHATPADLPTARRHDPSDRRTPKGTTSP